MPPSAVLLVDRLRWGGSELTFRLDRGETLLLLLGSESAATFLFRTLLGLQRPEGGELRLFDVPLESASERELLALRRRVGAVAASGGLISNLSLWENVALPWDYHARPLLAALQAEVARRLQQVGYCGAFAARIADLTSCERQQALLARALLPNPDLIVCEGLGGGLSSRERELLLESLREAQAETPGQSLLLLTTDPGFARSLAGIRQLDLSSGVGS